MNSPSNGCLDVLNCGAGHLTFRFDKNAAEEVEKAKKVLTDMLRRGYMIFVKVDGQQKRVRQFDAIHEEYILEEPDVMPEPPATPDPAPTESARRPVGRPKGLAGRRVSMRGAQ